MPECAISHALYKPDLAIQFHYLAAINIHTSPLFPGRLQCVKYIQLAADA